MFNNSDSKSVKNRKLFILLFILLILYLIYGFHLFSMQIIQGEHYKTQSRTISSQVTVISAQRGEIFDRNANLPMVINTESFAVEVTPGEIPAERYDTVIAKLANYLGMKKEDIDKNLDLFTEGDILLTQFENDMETVSYVIKKAYEKHMLVVVNPAPIKHLKEEYYQYIDYLVPNEHELEALSGKTDILLGAKELLSRGAKNVLVTLGEKGSTLINKEQYIKVEPHKVNAVDTTAAGDSYLGALVTKLSEGKEIKEAMEFASLCSSRTVTKKGAIVSLPHLDEL